MGDPSRNRTLYHQTVTHATAYPIANMSAIQTATIATTQPSNAAEILRMFPEINTHLATQTQTHTTNGNDSDLAGYDEEQIRLMDEVCIVLDENDLPIGSASKKICHLMENIDKGLLHRAFSCFLFDKDNKLLLQQRASEKITFPDMWTNTCCSHPLAVKQEMVPEAQLGVRRAAVRKLQHELGITMGSIDLDNFAYITRIHYLAPSDGMWGEHEIDYILFTTADVAHEANPNEVSDTCWVSKEELEKMFADNTNSFTPWFKLIAESFLYKWWDALLERTAASGSAKAGVKAEVDVLREIITEQDKNEIHRMVK